MPPLFKDGAGTLEQAMDLARRRDFDRASERFLDASKKLLSEGSVPGANRARAYAELFSPGVRNGNPQSLVAFASYLRSTLPSDELRPGPRSISSADLATQLELTARNANLMAAMTSGSTDGTSLAQAIQALANDYRSLGDQVLFVPELYDRQSIPASSRVTTLMAMSFEVLGAATQATDPLSAAEHFQSAQQYWMQVGDEQRAQGAAERVGRLSFQARCWLCGREGTGHGVQFATLPITEDVSGLKGTENAPLPSLDKSGTMLYVCKGCYSAVHGLADRIAMARASEVERRLLAEIQRIERRLQMPTSARR